MKIWEDRPLNPMLLEEAENSFNNEDYLFEIKFDGIRAIIYANKKELKIYSRNNKDITHLYPELQRIKNIVTKNTIFDGEIVLFENNKPSFSKLLERNNVKNKEKIKGYQQNYPVIFMCFDILYENKDLTNLSLIKRKKVLEKYEDIDEFNKATYVQNEGIKLFQKIKKLNLEGIVAKKKDSLYEIGVRTNNWLKIKNIHEDNFVIIGYKINKNNLSLYLGEYKDEKLTFVGKVSLAKKYKFSKKLMELKGIINTNKFDDIDKNVIYIKPDNIIRVRYLERGKNNHLRHPVVDKKTLNLKKD